jgi:hypothetical protein
MKTCIVYNCPNKENEGLFIGALCAPCYEHITEKPKGKREYSQAWRNAMETAAKYDKDRIDTIKEAFKTIESLTKSDLVNYPTWYKLREDATQ